MSESPTVVRSSEITPVTLSPTNHFRFPFAGLDGHPEIYLERSGQGDGPPLHSHPWPTWELVLEGSVRFEIDGESVDLGAGDSIYTPPDAAHTYTVLSAQARLVGINGPGSKLHSLQSMAAPLFAKPGPPDMRVLQGIAAENQVTLLGPPIAAREG